MATKIAEQLSVIPYKGKYSNIDALYGPYDEIPSYEGDFEKYTDVGFTIGVYEENKTKVREYVLLKIDDDYRFIEKVELFELKIEYFNINTQEVDNATKIIFTYKIKGKGLLPKVSITGTSISQKLIILNLEYSEEIILNLPGNYSYTLIVQDSLGNGDRKEESVDVGTIISVIVDNTVKNITPEQSNYVGKQIKVTVYFNSNKVTNPSLMFNEIPLLPEVKSGKTYNVIFPDNGYNNGDNTLSVSYYDENNDPQNKIIKTYSILSYDNFKINIEDWPSSAFFNQFILVKANIQYGGSSSENPLTSVLLIIKYKKRSDVNFIELDNHPTLLLNFNQYIKISLPEFNSEESCVYDFLFSLNNINQSNYDSLPKTITLKKSETPNSPIGQIYYNYIKKTYNIESFSLGLDQSADSINDNIFPDNGLISWNLNYLPDTLFLNAVNCTSFNLDFSISIPKGKDNDKLIEIKSGSNIILQINRKNITSLEKYFTQRLNYIVLPKENPIHIGFGCQRSLSNGYYYNCIYINGELVFSSDRFNDSMDGFNVYDNFLIYFNKSFEIQEFAFNTLNTDKSISRANGSYEDYIIDDLHKDVFYYNYLSTKNEEPESISMLKLTLASFVKPDNDEDGWWTALQTKLGKLGSPIKKIDLNNKCIFGNIVRDRDKPGIQQMNNGYHSLLNFTKDDKDGIDNNTQKVKKLDKLYGVLCHYSLDGYTPSDDYNRFCIVLVQGTSTLAYPIPNFLITFIKWKQLLSGEYTFELDNSVDLNYLYPNLQIDEKNENFILSKSILGETTLVTKADSMDSSHLNNTPTAIIYDSLTDIINNDKSGRKDSIVGHPILIEIGDDTSRTYSNKNPVSGVSSLGTFMLNTGKEAKCLLLGLKENEDEMYSLEGQSNDSEISKGVPGMFLLPGEGSDETVDENSQSILSSFEKLNLVYDDNNKTVNISFNNGFDNNDKINIANFLINNSAFESRSSIKDEDLLELGNWDKFLPILRMWLFVNEAEDEKFKEYFDKVFDFDYAAIYYIFLMLFGLTDNLGKNMMLDCWNTSNSDTPEYTKWYIRPYDLDSQCGLDNNGNDIIDPDSCLSEEHLKERLNSASLSGIEQSKYERYHSGKSKLWIKFWKAFKSEICLKYRDLRNNYLTSEKIKEFVKKSVHDLIPIDKYNLDFYLKYYSTTYNFLTKGSRFTQYCDWLEKRFMYCDSYFYYFNFQKNNEIEFDTNIYGGLPWKIGKTLIPTFYTAGQEKLNIYYGNKDNIIRNEIDRGSIKYSLSIVKESVLSISPTWKNINLQEFINLQEYNGGYINLKEFNNLYEINYTNGGNSSTDLELPLSVSKLSLTNNTFNKVLIEADSNLEEIIISNCKIENLSVTSVSLLRKLRIENNSEIRNISLSDLNLSEFLIDHTCIINNLNISSDITLNNEINLSGFNSRYLVVDNTYPNLQISCPNLEKLNIDILYNIDNRILSVYDEYTRTALTYNLDLDKMEIVKVRDNNGNYSYVHEDLGDSINNFQDRKLIPKINILDLSGCSTLKTFSCIGCEELKILTLGNTITKLNIQFCINLETLNYSKLNESDKNIFDFTLFTNLESLPFYSIGYSKNSNYKKLYIDAININTNSFNLIGCDSVQKINIYSNNVSSNFTGERFTSGCRKLETIDSDNLKLIFKNLNKSFLMNEAFLDISDVIIDTSNLTNMSYAFSDCNSVDINSILNALKDVSVNADFIMVGSKIKLDIGEVGNPIELKWTSTNSSFAYPIYSDFGSHSYEMVSTKDGISYGIKWELNANLYNTYLVNLYLPNTTSVYRMFTNLYIKLNTDVFKKNNSYNTSLTTATAFLGGTKQEDPIDFYGCSALTNVSWCYCKTNVDHLNTNDGSTINYSLPLSIRSAAGLFADNPSFDKEVEGIFDNLLNLTNARSAFRNTNCKLSGNPFNTNVTDVDISCMFGRNNNEVLDNDPFETNWINPNMITKNTSERSHVDLTSDTYVIGIFEGRYVYLPDDINFSNQNVDNGGLKDMFKKCTICPRNENGSPVNIVYTITALDSSGIFDQASFPTNVNTTIIIGDSVKILDKAFRNINNSRVTIKLNSNIESLDYTFLKCSGINFDLTETVNGLDTTIYLKNLKSAKYTFLQAGDGINIFDFDNASKLTTIRGIFRQCEKPNLSPSFNNCGLITDITEAFFQCNLVSINSIFGENNGNNAFIYADRAFREISISPDNSELYLNLNFNTSAITISDVFAQCNDLEGRTVVINGSNYLKNLYSPITKQRGTLKIVNSNLSLNIYGDNTNKLGNELIVNDINLKNSLQSDSKPNINIVTDYMLWGNVNSDNVYPVNKSISLTGLDSVEII